MDTSEGAEFVPPQSWRLALWPLFAAYVLVWLVLPQTVNETLNRDTIQIVYWGREWQMGYFKHPPLIAWVGEVLRLTFGPSDTTFYLTSQAMVLGSFFAVHRLARRYLAPWPAVMAVLALPSMGYYSFILPNLNHNIMVMLPWSLTILLAHRAIEDRRRWAWPALGLCFGVGILAKYAILILAPLILAHIVATPHHRCLLARPGPWLAAGICLLVISPHLLWLDRHDFAPLVYLINGAGIDAENPAVQHLAGPLVSLAKMGGMAGSLLLLLCASLGLPRRKGVVPSSQDRLLVIMTAGPVALVLLLGLLTGGEIQCEWAAPFFLPLPLLLLRLFYRSPGPEESRSFLAWLSGLSVAMATTYLLIFSGTVPIVDETEWSAFPARALAEKVATGWAGFCDGPVPIIVGDSWLAGTASYLLPGQPRVYAEADRRMSSWLSDADIRHAGAVIVWNREQPGQFRELDHDNEDDSPDMGGWFPGLKALEVRFGTIVPLPDVVLPYAERLSLPAVRLGLAVVPPDQPCR